VLERGNTKPLSQKTHDNISPERSGYHSNEAFSASEEIPTPAKRGHVQKPPRAL